MIFKGREWHSLGLEKLLLVHLREFEQTLRPNTPTAGPLHGIFDAGPFGDAAHLSFTQPPGLVAPNRHFHLHCHGLLRGLFPKE